MIGMRIIISEKGEVTSSPVTVTHTSYTDNGDNNHDSNSSSDGAESHNSGSTGSGSGKDDEEAAVWRVYSIVCSALSSSASAGGSAEWIEDKSRFKDYITAPKPSGCDPASFLLPSPHSVTLSVIPFPSLFFSLCLSLPLSPFFRINSFSLSLLFLSYYICLSFRTLSIFLSFLFSHSLFLTHTSSLTLHHSTLTLLSM